MNTIYEKMPSVQTLSQWFRAYFPQIIRKQETVENIFANPSNKALTYAADGKDVGILLWNENVVLMFCVLPEYRNRGIGSALLSEAEARIGRNGFSEIRFCDGFDYLTPGIPMWDCAAYRNNRAYFEKRGYRHAWNTCECVDMSMDMSDCIATEHRIGDTINGVTYRYAEKNDMRRVTDCTDDGFSDFTEYYRNESLYEPQSDECVLIAEKDGLVVGTLMVNFETEQRGIGSVGCTVTRTSYQNQGIATTLVQLGTGAFRARKIPRAYLGYTYTDIIPMYARSGYAVSMRYFMGIKELSPSA